MCILFHPTERNQNKLMSVEEAQKHCQMLHSFMSLHCFTDAEDLPSCHNLNTLGYEGEGWCVQIPALKMIIWKDEFKKYMEKNKLAPIREGSDIYVYTVR